MDEGSSRAPADAVSVSDEQHHPLDVGRLRRLAGFVLEAQDVPPGAELSVVCATSERMRDLNSRHMGEDRPTDVLAFPIDDSGRGAFGEPGLLGDVVLCPAVAAEQAARRERPVDDELDLLLVHGILHLLGHDHAVPAERDAMFALTDRLLAGFAAPGKGRR